MLSELFPASPPVPPRTAGDIGRRRHAVGARLALLVVLAGGLGRTHHLAVGIVLVFLQGHPVAFEIGGHLDTGLAGADHAFHQILDGLAHALFGVVAGRVGGRTLTFAIADPGQKLAALVDHGDPVRLQVRHGGGDHVLHSANLQGVWLAARDPDHHRG